MKILFMVLFEYLFVIVFSLIAVVFLIFVVFIAYIPYRIKDLHKKRNCEHRWTEFKLSEYPQDPFLKRTCTKCKAEESKDYYDI